MMCLIIYKAGMWVAFFVLFCLFCQFQKIEDVFTYTFAHSQLNSTLRNASQLHLHVDRSRADAERLLLALPQQTRGRFLMRDVDVVGDVLVATSQGALRQFMVSFIAAPLCVEHIAVEFDRNGDVWRVALRDALRFGLRVGQTPMSTIDGLIYLMTFDSIPVSQRKLLVLVALACFDNFSLFLCLLQLYC